MSTQLAQLYNNNNENTTANAERISTDSNEKKQNSDETATITKNQNKRGANEREREREKIYYFQYCVRCASLNVQQVITRTIRSDFECVRMHKKPNRCTVVRSAIHLKRDLHFTLGRRYLRSMLDAFILLDREKRH